MIKQHIGNVITGKNHVNVPVFGDIKAAAQFYVDVFNLPGFSELSEEVYILNATSGTKKILLWQIDDMDSGQCMNWQGNVAPHLVLNVKDLDGVFSKLTEKGIVCDLPPCDMFFRILIFRDPYGNGITVLQEPDNWSKQIGRTGDADLLDWVKIPVQGSVQELLQTAEWYQTVLGVHAGEPNQEQEEIDINPGNLQLKLDDRHSKAHFMKNGEYVPLLNLQTIDFDTVKDSLSHHNAAILSIGESYPRSLVFMDPNGNAIGIVEAV